MGGDQSKFKYFAIFSHLLGFARKLLHFKSWNCVEVKPIGLLELCRLLTILVALGPEMHGGNR